MPSLEKPAIVLAPYGSLSPRALSTYERIRKAYEREFPGTLVRLAFTSRLMIKRLREKEGIGVASPLEALAELHSGGCRRVVLQSLQIVPGSEFHLLASLVQDLKSHGAKPEFEHLEIGLPLLSSLEDCRRVSRVLPALWNGPGWKGDNVEEGQPHSLQSLPDREPEKEAVLLAGHGTGHPADALYSLMARVLEKDHRNVFLGTLEGFPGLSEMVAELKSFGIRKVMLLPFLLVAGGHAENDIAGAAPESWKSSLEREGFVVEVHLRGLSETEGIVSILLEHSRSALLKMEEGEGEEEGRRKIDNRTGIELRRKNDR
jgi:sirohydrochlorin cobaltochelatase